MRAWTLTALLCLTALSGCLTDASEPVGDDFVRDDPLVLVDALAAWAAGETSANVDLLGIWGEGGGEEVDAWGDYLFVDRGSTVHIVQRTVEADGSLRLETVSSVPLAGPKDVKVSDDGNWMFVGNDDPGSMAPVGGTARDGGFYVFDVSDKTDPKQTSYLPVGPRRGPHMVFYHQQADGTELVFGANGDVSINAFDRASGSLTELARYAPDYVTDVNRDPGVVDAYYQTFAHDMFVMEDPVENRTLMYVSNWDAGLRVVDVTDPADPVELGGWNDFPDGDSGNLHTAATAWIGDRRITVGSVEVGFAVVGGLHYARNEDQSAVYVWDTTDPADIRLLSRWENPDDAPAGRDMVPDEAISSVHNLQVEGGRVYLAHYALGLFVLDISTPELQAAPLVVGFDREEGTNVWDVIVHDGVIYESGALGVRAHHFVGDVLGEGGIRSRA